jgi:hypothetical protein
MVNIRQLKCMAILTHAASSSNIPNSGLPFHMATMYMYLPKHLQKGIQLPSSSHRHSSCLFLKNSLELSSQSHTNKEIPSFEVHATFPGRTKVNCT